MAQGTKTLRPSRSVAGIMHYARKVLHLDGLLEGETDGRRAPRLCGGSLLRALLTGLLLRCPAYSRIANQAGGAFSDDALHYFTEHARADVVRQALVGMLRRAKRNKAYASAPLIGLAIDGTKLGHFSKAECSLCRAHDAERPEKGHYHGVCALTVAGVGLTLPVDVEPYGPGDSEYAAGQRLLKRAAGSLGPRFAQYVAGDGNFATAPFLHVVGECGLYALARLKDNLPELCKAARARFLTQPAHLIIKEDKRRIEIWDAADFEPWDALKWPWVRVLRYRYEEPDGNVVDAYWLTNMPEAFAPTQTLYTCAKSRWEIENQGFNDAKNRYGLAHTPHHHENSLLIHWLLVMLTMTLERLYRLRHLRRGTHLPLSAQTFHDCLWRSLPPKAFDTG